MGGATGGSAGKPRRRATRDTRALHAVGAENEHFALVYPAFVFTRLLVSPLFYPLNPLLLEEVHGEEVFTRLN